MKEAKIMMMRRTGEKDVRECGGVLATQRAKKAGEKGCGGLEGLVPVSELALPDWESNGAKSKKVAEDWSCCLLLQDLCNWRD